MAEALEVDLNRFAVEHARGELVIDVREPQEYAAGHVPGARLIPLTRLAATADDLPAGRPIFVICASGNRSRAAAGLLRRRGLDAYSVARGTGGWTATGRPVVTGVQPGREGTASVVAIAPIDTPTLGDRSYLAHDGAVALVVDPQRDIDRVLAIASAAGVRITHVFETHIHNDYVTGGAALAAATGAAYHVNADDPVTFDRVPVRDGDVIMVGDRRRVRVLATPGHTFTHLAYALERGTGDGWAPVGVFTGGSLLHGAVGRPDLLGPAHAHALARHQYHSAHRVAALPGPTRVLPTHGFGSFCAATRSAADASTIAVERRVNPALVADLDTFLAEVFAGLDAWPAYYARMAPANLAGPAASDLDLPRPADATAIRASLDAGDWVIDLRHRVAFAAGHVPGTVNIGLDGDLATYLGWIVPADATITLLGGTTQQVLRARQELSRIGVDPAAYATGTPREWAGDRPLRGYPRADFADLDAVRHHRPVVVLDVRRNLEYAADHVDGAVHIPLHELPDRLDEVPAGEVWVHCAGGYRAAIAASLLAAAGRRVVHVDDDFARARAAQSTSTGLG